MCQIEHCWQYAEKYNRVLVLDTYRSEGIGVPFDKVFSHCKTRCEVLTLHSDSAYKELVSRSVYPAKARALLTPQPYNEPLPVDDAIVVNMNQPHDEDVLVHHSGGGGNIGYYALCRLVLSAEFRGLLLLRFQEIKVDHYSAAHIRNTDHKTNVRSFFLKISKEASKGTLAIATDNVSVEKEAKKYFKKKFKLVFPTRVYDVNNRPLHLSRYGKLEGERKQELVDCIYSLFLLGKSSRLFVSSIRDTEVSGFSLLGMSLFFNKSILDQLLGKQFFCGGWNPGWEKRILYPGVRLHSENTFKFWLKLKKKSAQGWFKFVFLSFLKGIRG